MLSAIRTRLHPTPAAVIAVVALVFAMSGGAFAAGRLLITSTKQISPKVLKSLKGAAGAKGATGAAGATGATGATGPAGAAGAGTAGAAGKEGPAGKEGAPGKEGKPGAEGQPWVPDNTLPSGAEETGVWGMTKLTANPGLGGLKIPISFTIPLATPLDGTHVHLIEEGETGPAHEGCGGGTGEEPTAEAGNLCIYITAQNEAVKSSFIVANPVTGEGGAGSTGAILSSGPTLEAGAFAQGDWVLRAPE
jgi:hypothetical protein